MDGGNRWIQLNFATENAEDSTEKYSICEIYHSPPDTSAANQTGSSGFVPKLDNATIAERTDDKGIVQLEYFDEFETYETSFDQAGHIANSIKKTYRLPKAEVNDDVDKLKALVGTDEDRDGLPDMESDSDKNLYGYVEENSIDIKQLEDFIGPWKNSTEFWDIYPVTLAEAIGNLDSMYGEAELGQKSQNRVANQRSFSEIIGNVKELWKNFNKGQYISISDILTEQNGDFAEQQAHLEVLDAAVANIGERSEGQDYIYTEIRKLDEAIQTLEDKHDTDKGDLEQAITDASNALTQAYTDADATVTSNLTTITNGLDGRLVTAENNIKTINETTLPNINLAISTVDSRVETHETYVSELKTNLEKADSNLDASISTLSTTVGENKAEIDKALEKHTTDIETNSTNIGTNAGNIETNSTNIAINAGNIATNSADIATNKADIATNKAGIEENSEAIDLINTKIGTIDTESPISVQLTNHLTDISNLKTDALMKTEAATTYAKIADLNSYVTEEKLTNDLSSIESSISTLENNFTTLGIENLDIEIQEGSTILKMIFEQLNILNESLTTVKNDVKLIQEKMNELHPDNPPFPTDPENGDDNSSTEPDPDEPNLNEPTDEPEEEPGEEPDPLPDEPEDLTPDLEEPTPEDEELIE